MCVGNECQRNRIADFVLPSSTSILTAEARATRVAAACCVASVCVCSAECCLRLCCVVRVTRFPSYS